MVEPALFGPIDAMFAPVIEYVVLVLVLLNMATRLRAHRRHRRQAEDGPDALSRDPLHESVNGLLVLATFYYLTVHYHSGVVLTVLVLAMVVADVFEFEARKVEAREELDLDRPKGALAASLVVLGYAAYVALFFVVEPLWSAIV